MLANLRDYVLVVCRHCGDAVTPREWSRGCLCGRTETLCDEDTGDLFVESNPVAAIVRFPGPALADGASDAAATADVGGTGRALAYVTLSGDE